MNRRTALKAIAALPMVVKGEIVPRANPLLRNVQLPAYGAPHPCAGTVYTKNVSGRTIESGELVFIGTMVQWNVTTEYA